MALPGDLYRLVLSRMSFTVVENWPPALLELWVRQNCPTPELYYADSLSATENLLNAAAWSGYVGYTNQLFLPNELTLLLSAAANQLAIFLDVILRGANYVYTANMILRNLMRDEKTAVTMLCYFLSANNNIVDTDILLDDLLLRRVVFTKSVARQLGEISNLRSVNPQFRLLLEGFNFAGRTVPVSFINGDFDRAFHFLVGYILAGGKGLGNLENPRFHMLAVRTMSVLNQVLFQDENWLSDSDDIALNHLAYHVLKPLAGKGERDFPADVLIQNRAAEILQERARGLLPLIPQIYRASAVRDQYLAQLHFIIDPIGQTEGENIQKNLRIIFGRFDLLNTAEVETVDNYRDEALEYTINPVWLAVRAAQRITPINLPLLFGIAVLRGQFPTVARTYFQRLRAHAIPLPNQLYQDTLVDIRFAFAKPLEPNLRTAMRMNTFVIGWLINAATSPTTHLKLSKTVQRRGQVSYHVEFFYYGRHVLLAMTAYSYNFLRTLLPAAQLPALTEEDALITGAKELLSHLIL